MITAKLNANGSDRARAGYTLAAACLLAVALAICPLRAESRELYPKPIQDRLDAMNHVCTALERRARQLKRNHSGPSATILANSGDGQISWTPVDAKTVRAAIILDFLSSGPPNISTYPYSRQAVALTSTLADTAISKNNLVVERASTRLNDRFGLGYGLGLVSILRIRPSDTSEHQDHDHLAGRKLQTRWSYIIENSTAYPDLHILPIEPTRNIALITIDGESFMLDLDEKAIGIPRLYTFSSGEKRVVFNEICSIHFSRLRNEP